MKKLKFGKLLLALLMSGFMIFAGCSAESSSGDDGDSSDPVETPSSDNPSSGTPSSGTPAVVSEETKTGTVSITVNVDGTVSCSKCGKTYSTKAEAESCEHYKCETCGTVYYSEDDAADCTSHVTVTFNDVDSTDSYTAQTAVTKTIKSGASVSAPEWTRENYVLSWVDESNVAVTFPVTLSVGEGETSKTVTYKAVWTASHKVTFKDASAYEGDTTNADVEIEVADGEVISESDVPSWTKTHYTLSWSSSVESVTTTSEITSDVTFTAVWTEDEYATVTFKDSASNSDDTSLNADVSGKVYVGETSESLVPSWTKTNYSLTWTSDSESVTSVETAIPTGVSSVTFTAKWTEKPKCSNCGTHYDTEEAVGKCAKKSGCPGFVAVAAGEYDLIAYNKKSNSDGIFQKQEAGASQTVSGITVTCKIDSNGANLSTKSGGSITFAITSDMTLTFTDSNSKGVVISTTDGYVGTSGTLTSSTTKGSYLGVDGKETSVKLGAGSYTIEGATKSSAKIATLTFAAVSE